MSSGAPPVPDPSPGFFGKVPARGDFIARRVPVLLQADWEAWLTALVLAARQALGDSWPDDWLRAPLWHCVLGSGLVPPAGAAGLLVASADRIGRLFPFTIIGAAAGPPADRTALYDWARLAELQILRAMEDDFDPEALDAAMLTLGPPPPVIGSERAVGHWPLSFDGDWPSDDGDIFEDSFLQPPGPDQSAWYCRGSDRVAPMHLRCTGLPEPTVAACMITGSFDFTAG